MDKPGWPGQQSEHAPGFISDAGPGDGQRESHDFGHDIESVTVSKKVNGQWKPATEFTDGDSVRVDISYELEANAVGTENKTIHYQLPDGITLAKQESGPVKDGNITVGTYTISEDGYIEIVFYDEFADDQPFVGTIRFEGQVWAKEGQDETEISFGDAGSIIVRPAKEPADVSVAKSGVYNKEDG